MGLHGKNIPESNKETEQHSTDDYLSFQSSDSINSDDTSTKTISAKTRADNADNEAVINTGHTAEHDVKAVSDNVDAIQNAHVSFGPKGHPNNLPQPAWRLAELFFWSGLS